MKKPPSSSALSKHLRAHQRNPASRAFAPLAQSYRELGMHREALRVLKQGLSHHPHYVAGLVVLAHVYYDTQKYRQVLKVLKPLVAKNPDHYTLQKLYAKSNLQLGLKEEALGVLKNLHFLNPKDQDIADCLRQLRSLEPELARMPARNSSKSSSLEEWVQVDFTEKSRANDLDETQAPIITHTLVDLYQKQGLIHKAIEVLEKMLVIDPNDVPSQERLEKLKQDLSIQRAQGQGVMDLWDEKFSPRLCNDSVEKALLDFLHVIKLRQNEKSACYQRP